MQKMSTRRKLAIATWGSPREGNIYGKMTLDATAVVAHLQALSQTSGEKLTITHFVGKVIAEALSRSPGLNGYIRLGAYHQHPSVDLSFLVNIGEGSDIGKVKVVGLDQKSIVELAEELRTGRAMCGVAATRRSRRAKACCVRCPRGHSNRRLA